METRVCRRIILKWVNLLKSSYDWSQLAVSYEHGNYHSFYQNGKEIIEYLRHIEIFKDSLPHGKVGLRTRVGVHRSLID